MFCQNCGSAVGDADRFCRACGHLVATSFDAPTFAPPSSTPSNTPPAPSGATKVTRQDAQGGTFILLLAAYFVISLLVYYKFVEQNIAVAIGWAFGGVFFWPALITGICHLFGAKRWRRNMLICTPIVGALAFYGAWPGSQLANTDRQQIHDAAVSIRSLAEKQTVRPADVPHERATSASTQSLGQATTNIAAILRRQNEVNEARRVRMDDLHIETVLAPSALITAAGIADSRQRLKEFFDIQQEIFADYGRTMDATRKELEKLPLNLREQALAAMAKTQPRVQMEINSYRNIEQRLQERSIQVLDLCQSNIGLSYTAGNQIYLPQSALETYQRLMRDIRELAAQEAKAETEILKLRQSGIDDLKKLERLTESSAGT